MTVVYFVEQICRDSQSKLMLNDDTYITNSIFFVLHLDYDDDRNGFLTMTYNAEYSSWLIE
jgi:hypothetical protein